MSLWVRCMHADAAWFGLLDGPSVALYDAAPWAAPNPTGVVVALESVTLLAPLEPGKFLGLWNNYHAMAAKQGNAIPAEPLYFLKAASSIVAHEADIRPPSSYAGRTIYEGELGVVIGQTMRDVDEATAEAGIFGYTCVNDVTALDLLTADPSFPQWARAKGCDTYGPVGPAIATGLDWRDLTIRARLGGRERQNYPASDMILPPPRFISQISREMTLHPGDLIACGTSLGALPMRPGMVIEIEIDGIGVLRNTMAAA